MELFSQFASVAFVLALVGGFAYWFRRGMPALPRPGTGRPSSGSGRLQILQRSPLTAQHCLHVVRMQDQEWIVATHPHGITVLRRRRAGPEGKEYTP